ncbi:MAG: sigma-70 family RNA polymerase sigma factor [Lachnospiraceae bacterium]|nr:sigma-70 family RNA polymerase sigma factor [Lachnospiraceae bacterium]
MEIQAEVSKLVELAQNGDSAAFGKLIERHERLVYNVVYRMLTNHEDTKDISQEVFLKAYKYLGKFDGKASFSTWLYRIAVNTSIDELRKRKGYETVSLDKETDSGEGIQKKEYADSSAGVEEQVMAKENIANIKQAMENISSEHRIIITLRDFEGLSYAEISEITQTSLGTVKSRLARARKALKDLIIEGREQNKKTFVR